MCAWPIPSLLSCQSWSLRIWLPIIILVIVSKLNIQLIRLKRKEDLIANRTTPSQSQCSDLLVWCYPPPLPNSETQRTVNLVLLPPWTRDCIQGPLVAITGRLTLTLVTRVSRGHPDHLVTRGTGLDY